MIRIPTALLLSLSLGVFAKEAPLPAELSAYRLTPVPEASVALEKGDRLAICGDSITEQRMYSVLIETYLAACLPELGITCRQYGWSGEQAGGFLARMDNDVLRFKPTIATSCYGMNDFRYVPFDKAIAAEYERNQTRIAEKFKAAGTRYVIGSSGIIDSVPNWVKTATGTKQELNLSLSEFRNIALKVARNRGAGFADVYRPMLVADFHAKQHYGETFQVSGKDGVHPGWAGHAIMAYAFLRSLGVDGDLGTITYDDATGMASSTGGHEILSASDGRIGVRSHRLAFAPGPGAADSDASLRAGMALVPFDAQLNRFLLKITNPAAESYEVKWGGETKHYTAAQLRAGINLAAEFHENPFVAPFRKIQAAVTAKQGFETKQIKGLVHGKQGKADMEGTFERSERERAGFVEKLAAAIGPVEHGLSISRAGNR
ncbi:SGNH/GDSL hydrolase family protein [Akkermansiaceae bacterium]|nr:SGNH/GDSL hydrolase family protein [Akkermansiaceae bacterium]